VVVVVNVATGGVGTGGAVTVVVTVFVLHVVTTVVASGLSAVFTGWVITGVPQLGPLHEAVFAMVSPAESVDFAVTWYVSVYDVPGATPDGMVQVIVPLLLTTGVGQMGGPPVHVGAVVVSRVALEGAASVTTIGAVVMAVPVFFTVIV